MDELRAWPSLADQRAVATQLYGPGGDGLVAEWLGEQLGRVDDDAFARTFSDHIRLPGIESRDYLHRTISATAGTLLGGIRFYNRDVGRPFVDVLAHSFTDLDALCDCVDREWAAFAPRYLRLCARPGAFSGARTILDVSIHAGRYADMAAPDYRVRLEPFPDPQDAVALIGERHRRLAVDDPRLARNVCPADPDDVRRWHRERRLHAVRVRDVTVGALAVAPDAVSWLPGDVVQEEVIAADHRDHGYAASAQAAWAARAEDPGRLLIGTIDRHNVASRRTAIRAGRPSVLETVFVALRFPTVAAWQ